MYWCTELCLPTFLRGGWSNVAVQLRQLSAFYYRVEDRLCQPSGSLHVSRMLVVPELDCMRKECKAMLPYATDSSSLTRPGDQGDARRSNQGLAFTNTTRVTGSHGQLVLHRNK